MSNSDSSDGDSDAEDSRSLPGRTRQHQPDLEVQSKTMQSLGHQHPIAPESCISDQIISGVQEVARL